MADETATFAVELEDETSGAAARATGALKEMRAAIDADVAALRQMQAAQRQLQQGTVVNVGAFKQLRDQITATKTRIANAQAQYVSLGGTFEKVKSPEVDATNIKDLADGAKGAVPVLGEFIERGNNLAKALGSGGVAGAFVVAGVAGLAFAAIILGAVIGAIVKVASFGLEAAAAYRQLSLSLELAAIAGKSLATSGDDAAQAVSNIAANVPIAAEEVGSLADQLLRAGVNGPKFEQALRAVSLAKVAGQDVKKLVAELKAAGGNIDAITDKIEGKFGPVVEAMMLDPQVQMKKFRENLAKLFVGLKIEPVLRSFRDFVRLFDESTSSGRALKTLLETIFNPIFAGLAEVGPAAGAFFKGMLVGALKVAIVVLTVKKRLEEAFGGKLDLGEVNWRLLGQVVLVAAVALVLVAAAIAAVVVWVGLMTAGVLLVVGAFIGLAVAAAVGIAMLVSVVVGGLSSLLNFVISRTAAMVDAGLQFAAGLAQGIRDGLSEVINAAAELAQGAVDSVKNKLKMRSPSRVMFEAGINTGEGFTGGLEESGSDVQAAAADAFNVAPAAAGGGSPAAPGGGGITFVFGPGSVVINGAGAGGEDLQELVRDGITEAIEECALHMGVPLKVEAAA